VTPPQNGWITQRCSPVKRSIKTDLQPKMLISQLSERRFRWLNICFRESAAPITSSIIIRPDRNKLGMENQKWWRINQKSVYLSLLDAMLF